MNAQDLLKIDGVYRVVLERPPSGVTLRLYSLRSISTGDLAKLASLFVNDAFGNFRGSHATSLDSYPAQYEYVLEFDP